MHDLHQPRPKSGPNRREAGGGPVRLFLLAGLFLVCQARSAVAQGEPAEGEPSSPAAPAAVVAGCTSGDCNGGFGVRVDPDGSRYEGQFHEGRPAGHGLLLAQGTAIKAGTFRDGVCVGSPKDEVLVLAAAQLSDLFTRALPRVAQAALADFVSARGEATAPRATGAWSDRAWRSTVGTEIDRNALIEGMGPGSRWTAILARRTGVVAAQVNAMVSCAGLAAALARSGDRWRSLQGIGSTSSCGMVAESGGGRGATVYIGAGLAPEPDGSWPVVMQAERLRVP